jgi:hypothetical protein
MRKILFSVAAVSMALVMVGVSSGRRGKANDSRDRNESNTVVQNTPGTRCTRLSYPKDKKNTNGVVGARCSRLFFPHPKGNYLPNQPPTVDLKASVANITLPCKSGETSTACATDACQIVILNARASDPDGDTVLYTYTTTGGRITGDGSAVIWNLKGAEPGSYTASAEVDDGCGCIAISSAQVTLASCSDCK